MISGPIAISATVGSWLFALRHIVDQLTDEHCPECLLSNNDGRKGTINTACDVKILVVGEDCELL